jgi:hypothetical protein
MVPFWIVTVGAPAWRTAWGVLRTRDGRMERADRRVWRRGGIVRCGEMLVNSDQSDARARGTDGGSIYWRQSIV